MGRALERLEQIHQASSGAVPKGPYPSCTSLFTPTLNSLLNARLTEFDDYWTAPDISQDSVDTQFRTEVKIFFPKHIVSPIFSTLLNAHSIHQSRPQGASSPSPHLCLLFFSPQLIHVLAYPFERGTLISARACCVHIQL